MIRLFQYMLVIVYAAFIVAAQAKQDTAAIIEETEYSVTTPNQGQDEAKTVADTGAPAVTDAIDTQAKDIILVLDNSGSMKKNDPDFLVKQAAIELIKSQQQTSSIAVIIFDQDVRLVIPLTGMLPINIPVILSSLDQIDYKGRFTDSPAAIERAIYELKTNGRDQAQRVIIFVTDGIVDTGDTGLDLEKLRWLKDDLARDAADSAIKIFGIAFTEAADFQLIQSLAQNTDGAYYRVLAASGLSNVFTRINQIMNMPVAPESVAVIAGPQLLPPAVTPPIIIETPIPAANESESIHWIITVIAATAFIILFVAILLLRRDRKSRASEQPVRDAYLNDLQGNTTVPVHRLGKKPVILGRIAGKDTEQFDYIVVNEATIGRRHALIEYKNHAFWLVDQGSINGTLVNGEPVRDNKVRLVHNDRIRLHTCEFEFIFSDMEDGSKTMIAAANIMPGMDTTVQLTEPPNIDDEKAASLFGSNAAITDMAGGQTADNGTDVTAETVLQDDSDLKEQKLASDEKTSNNK